MFQASFKLQQEIVTLANNICSQKQRPPFSNLKRIMEATAQLIGSLKIPQTLQQPDHVDCITKMLMIILKGMETHSVSINIMVNSCGLVQKTIHILQESSHQGPQYQLSLICLRFISEQTFLSEDQAVNYMSLGLLTSLHKAFNIFISMLS